MPELLLELLSEEIPARMQARAAEDLQRLFDERLKDGSLSFERVRAFVTPRRLTLVVDGLPMKQPDIHDEKKGPRVGAPEQAIQGFLKSVGLSNLDQCEKRIVGKAEFWFAKIQRQGAKTEDIIVSLVSQLIWTFPWPKSMRWSAGPLRWVRPLREMVCIFDGQVTAIKLPFRGLADIDSLAAVPALSMIAAPDSDQVQSDRWTRGHRFMAPGEVEVTGFADYQAKLRERFVIVDQNERRETIRKQVEEAAHAEGLKVKDDPALLDEVTGLVEWPVALVGDIEKAFMDLPP